jgi:hypothetical protein
MRVCQCGHDSGGPAGPVRPHDAEQAARVAAGQDAREKTGIEQTRARLEEQQLAQRQQACLSIAAATDAAMRGRVAKGKEPGVHRPTPTSGSD